MPKYHVTLCTTQKIYNVYELEAESEDAAIDNAESGEVVEEWITEDSVEVTNVETDDDDTVV